MVTVIGCLILEKIITSPRPQKKNFGCGQTLKKKFKAALRYYIFFLVSCNAEPGAASLAWWYMRWCLSAVCLCQRLPSRLLTSVIAAVSLCEPVAGKRHTTRPSLRACHAEEEKRQKLRHKERLFKKKK